MTEFKWNELGDVALGRENLGDEMPVALYRLFQYTMRGVLAERYGSEEMKEVFRLSGERAGAAFAKNVLDCTLDQDGFLAQLQQKLIELKVGVLRVERFDAESGHAVFTVSEDLDCSGLPMTGDTVCNYDEGFLTGVLQVYTGHPYTVREIDCWATGARVCRFDAKMQTVGSE